MSSRIAVYCASQRLYPHVIPAIKSMLLNGHPDKIYLLIEDDKFPEWLPQQVETINVRDQKFFPLDGPNIQTYFTYMALMRAALTQILPNEDRVLSLDCDTLVKGSIDEVWDKDLGDYYLSASREPQKCRWDRMYYNTGVALFNLKAMREDGIDKKIIDLINSQKLVCPEQDAICIVCADNIMEMPSDFNANRFTVPTDDIRIQHHCGFKHSSWAGFSDVNDFRRLEWRHVLRHYENH